MDRAGYSMGIGIGVGLVSSALMLTQLVLTRIFSVVIWYHFAFFAISVALLGLGVGAVVVHGLRARLASVPTAALASSVCAALAVSLVVLDLGLVHLAPDWFGARDPSIFTSLTSRLGLLFVSCAVPFSLGGFVLALCLSRYPAAVARLYRWDLIGAALGCLAVIPLLARLGGPLALMGVAATAAFASLAFARAQGRSGPVWVAYAVALSVAAGATLGGGAGWFSLRVAKGLDMVATPPEFARWNSFSMVTVFDEPFFRGWGLSPRYEGSIPPQKRILIDMNAMTPIVNADAVPDGGYVTQDLSVAPYHLASPERVCVIGAGGGKDVLAALRMGAKHITAVEVNPLIVEALRGPYRNFSGALYDRPEVTVVVDDGRSFARRTQERFDVVLLSMVDTSAATAAGAYTMTENGLYTVDAFVDFMELLKPGGILSVATVSLEGLPVGPRLASIARAALSRRGADPSISTLAMQTPWLSIPGATMYNFMLRPDGFSHTAGWRGLLGFTPAFEPGQRAAPPGPEAALIHGLLASDATVRRRALSSTSQDVSAIDDDRPFFFYQSRARDLWDALWSSGRAHLLGNGLDVLAKVLLIALLASALLLLAPLLTRKMRAGGAHELGYVAFLGLGFMFVEIGLLQKVSLYIGQPTYALAAVLFVLLGGAGLGSGWLAPRVARQAGRSTGLMVLLFVAGYAALTTPVFGAVIDATVALPVTARAAITALWLAPLGVAAGVPLPAALTLIGGAGAERLPWLWAVNSATGVLGSVLATVVALHFGIQITLLCGAALYLCAAVLWRMLRP